MVLGTQLFENNSSIEQQFAWKFSKSVLTTSSFTNQVGASITVGTQFSCGVPILAQGKVSVEISASYSHTWGTQNTTQQAFEAEFPLKCPPSSSIEATATISQTRATVPYEFEWKTLSGRKVITKGVWTGVNVYDLKFSVAKAVSI